MNGAEYLLAGCACTVIGMGIGIAIRDRVRRFRRAHLAKYCSGLGGHHGIFHKDLTDCPFCGQPLELVTVFLSRKSRSRTHRNPHRFRRNPPCCPEDAE